MEIVMGMGWFQLIGIVVFLFALVLILLPMYFLRNSRKRYTGECRVVWCNEGLYRYPDNASVTIRNYYYG